MTNPSPMLSILGPVQIGQKNRTKDFEYEDGWPSGAETHEIEVPTCSYRMGVTSMGYGYALFGK